MMELKEKLKNMPDSCGVYIMKDNKGKVIYVGKARSLRRRVKSYFGSSSSISPKVSSLVGTISDVEYIVTESEKEALLIEYSLIKRYRPKYNTDYKDDKRYPFIELTVFEDFPRLVIRRTLKKDKGKYYGPYPDGTSLRNTIRWIRKVFPLRTCKKTNLPKEVCLDYHIKRCLAPCIGETTKKSYHNVVKEVDLFLKGEHNKLLSILEARMEDASERLDFEEATRIRNEIFALRKLTERINFRQVNKEAIFKELCAADDISNRVSALKEKLSLRKHPDVIEAFDVSNISGKEAVGSMVVFVCAEAAKDRYRRFKIKTVHNVDDCGMIKEIVKRRYKRLIKEKGKFPDLILIDGGKPQLNAAYGSLRELGIDNLAIIALAKKFEHVFIPLRKSPVIIGKTSGALHLLQQIRDEAHRFAISYHRHLRRKLR